VRQAVAELVDRVRSSGVPGGGRDVRWVRLDGLHLTLRFIGPTLDERIAAARDAVVRAAARSSPFELSIGGAGTFPPGPRPRALWLGVDDPGHDLERLAGLVSDRLGEAGWPADTRPFQAHLTLARADGVPAGARIGALLRDAAEGLRIAATIDRIGLFESLTGGGPARYEPIELVRLGDG
jgi:2'-5' RNA ligase